ncbi:hemicentin-1-like [Ornithodoros turicata]|uniref:hemicentin-1-like n=1 Tax=Ornithodoros turicata TaxID=34597 RepID=UPI003138ACA3
MDLTYVVLIVSGAVIAVTESHGDMYIQPAKSHYHYFTHHNFFVTCYPGAGSHNPQLVWRGPDGRDIRSTHGRIHIVPPSESDPGLKLVVENVLEQDKGRYTCASLSDGNDVFFNLTVYRAITFEGTEEIQSAPEGQDFTLKCQVDAETKPDVSWNRNGAPIKDPKKYKMTEEGLFIKNLTRQDAGNYTCLAFVAATHLTGYNQKTLKLNVLYGPEFKQPVQEEAYTTPGSTATMICEAEGSPVPMIQWFQDGDGIAEDDEHEIIGDIGSSTLKVKVTDKNQFGEYTCRVSNDLGASEHVITLKEGEAPKAPKVRVVDANPNTLVLKIEHPGKSPLKVVGFKVQYKAVADTWDMATTQEYKSGNGIQYTLQNLNHGTNYAIRVSARNAAGYGDFSEDVYYRTKDPQHYTQANKAGCSGSFLTQFGVVALSIGYLALLKL